MVRLRRAGLGYADAPVLQNIDLSVGRGEIVAILGRSGSGKTTLLQTILGLAAPLAGTVELLGAALPVADRHEREQLFARIGVVFQHNALFSNMTVAENLTVVASQQSDLLGQIIAELVRMRLRSVGLRGFEDRRPDHLSGGQRKRLAFARAIMLEPEVLLCDEPTAGLDPLTALQLSTLIDQLGRALHATMLIITHDTALIEAIATRIIVIHDGRIYADGQLSELSKSTDPVIAGLLGRRSVASRAP